MIILTPGQLVSEGNTWPGHLSTQSFHCVVAFIWPRRVLTYLGGFSRRQWQDSVLTGVAIRCLLCWPQQGIAGWSALWKTGAVATLSQPHATLGGVFGKGKSFIKGYSSARWEKLVVWPQVKWACQFRDHMPLLVIWRFYFKHLNFHRIWTFEVFSTTVKVELVGQMYKTIVMAQVFCAFEENQILKSVTSWFGRLNAT